MFLPSVHFADFGASVGYELAKQRVGTAVGATVAWEPFDFGLRKANIEIAESARNRAERRSMFTKLQVAAAAADAYLTILAAQQTVTAAKAGVETRTSPEPDRGTLVKKRAKAWRRGVSDEGGARGGSRNAINPG